MYQYRHQNERYESVIWAESPSLGILFFARITVRVTLFFYRNLLLFKVYWMKVTQYKNKRHTVVVFIYRWTTSFFIEHWHLKNCLLSLACWPTWSVGFSRPLYPKHTKKSLSFLWASLRAPLCGGTGGGHLRMCWSFWVSVC